MRPVRMHTILTFKNIQGKQQLPLIPPIIIQKKRRDDLEKSMIDKIIHWYQMNKDSVRGRALTNIPH